MGVARVLEIRPFTLSDTDALIDLWHLCGLTRPWNPPARDIAEKQKFQPELFLIMFKDQKLIGSVMGAYDGHRGVINYFAIHPEYQNQGYGVELLTQFEAKLKAMGCPKINLMVRADNLEAQNWYQSRGYRAQDVVVLGKWLEE